MWRLYSEIMNLVCHHTHTWWHLLLWLRIRSVNKVTDRYKGSTSVFSALLTVFLTLNETLNLQSSLWYSSWSWSVYLKCYLDVFLWHNRLCMVKESTKLCTIPFKTLGSVIFVMVLKEISYTYQGCIYLDKKIKAKTVVLWNIMTMCSILIYFTM